MESRFNEGEFDRFLANHMPHIYGKPTFSPVDYGDLKVGSQVVRFGTEGRNGKETSSTRVWEFNLPFEYVGTIEVDVKDYRAFRLPDAYVPEQYRPAFILMIDALGSELLVQHYDVSRGNTVLKAVFKLKDGSVVYGPNYKR